ncbi:MAG: phenylalanine--tRNA ligase subunit beta [Candidatus Krumholzibacteria bacterium]|nr:phenylalanine--tRNA ligase subunit beta [Candidatus Krumholzibacteria bacterium]MDH4336445.1 phenylalanine--tRNA ligase subunit beta [Candidatus Krumholzibacteria bacterium]MDH5269037.1 phenylalanine--tRNA ligase subunit beta [Candidatus Krumholzibacteria bacterium]
MIVSLSWLRKYVDIAVDARALADDLTMHGIKVERLLSSGLTERLVVVGHVLSVAPHPGADRLHVCSVDVGAASPLEIVCGAPNVAAGQRVPVALVGARLPNGVKIRKSKIRGVASQGMICSQIELGLGTESGGIIVLPAETQIGAVLADVLGASDATMELEITPNRPDQLGHVGVAREVAALYDVPLRVPQPAPSASDSDDGVSIDIESPEECFRFVARVVRGVKVGPSPAWLQGALEKVGVNSINNVVDATNYVMLEIGQPLHAYDLKKLRSTSMGVRRGRRGERLEVLDGTTRELGPEHLIITCSDDAVGVAGVIGGMPTAIDDETTDILLECAAFAPRVVRATRRALNISTDASYRFERGSDRDICAAASRRALEIILETAGGTAGREVDVFPAPREIRNVTIRRSTVRRLLGEDLPVQTVTGLLERLAFHRVSGDENAITVSVPSFRWDIFEEADLVEEVARMYGYDNIGRGWKYRVTVPSAPDAFDRFLERVAAHLGARGHTEFVTSAFTDGRELRWFDWPDADPRSHPMPLKNPLSTNHAYMRTHLLPGVLDAVAHNISHGRRELSVFSIGRVFLRAERESGLPDEPTHVVLVRTRPRGATFWRGDESPPDLFEIKAEVETLLAAMRPAAGEAWSYDFAPSRGEFRYSDRGGMVAEGGIIPVAAARELGIEQPAWYAAIDLSALFEVEGGTAIFRPFSEFPSSRRDLSLVAPAGVSWSQIEKHVAKVGGRLLESLLVFDVFRGASIDAEQTAYGVRLSFRSSEGTLKDSDVDAIVTRIVGKLEAELGVVLRS